MRESLRGLFLTATILVCSATLWSADSLFVGTWKFNQDKSKPGDLSATIKFEALPPNGIKFTRDIIEAPGNPAHWEWSGQFDGNDNQFTGSPNYDGISLKRFDDRTLVATNKKGGKVMTTAWYCVSKDGKALAVTTAGVNTQGREVVFYSVYDKQ